MSIRTNQLPAMRHFLSAGLLFAVLAIHGQEPLTLNHRGYLHRQGLDVTFFSDYYPEGHQSGVSIIQHGVRVAANGDLRLEVSPGQWDPVPKGGKRTEYPEEQRITQRLWFPDSAKDRRGFNPVIYPDLQFFYDISIQAEKDGSVTVTVDLDEILPEEWVGKVGFNLELFPGDLFGKSFLMDSRSGIFPDQAMGPLQEVHGRTLGMPLGEGSSLVIAPESELQRMVIRSEKAPLELWDGRMNHNNGWYIVRSLLPGDTRKEALKWNIRVNTVKDWKYAPVIQVSQLGYHPDQSKIAVVEVDPLALPASSFVLYRLGEEGPEKVMDGRPQAWGDFLRYSYLELDFTSVSEPGIYQVGYEESLSHPFRIAREVYAENTWQSTLEYYLPVQMCHMRVNEKYRVWHDLCHMDDAAMAPPIPFHFDGYSQAEKNHTHFEAGDFVEGLNQGGWHDAGDYDLRVESQAGTVWLLARMVEEFGLDHDATLIDFENHLVEIHEPDGKNDALQQVEHGLATILGGYRSLGRLYRGIICRDLRQYVMLGDAASMTDNIPGNEDDRWVFTEENPRRELQVIPALAASYRVLREVRPNLAAEALETARALWENASPVEGLYAQKAIALGELILSTGEEAHIKALVNMEEDILESISRCGWALGDVLDIVDDRQFSQKVTEAVSAYQEQLSAEQEADSPYGVPYKPNIWGAGWNIQRFGVEQYFYHKTWPELASAAYMENALNFILGVHPGSNNASFASGVGSSSIKVAYGVNRAEWSFIPGGVVSGTALIRPDFPELKTWPFLWQQTEYVMGGGATNFMFLLMAVDALYN